MSDELDNLFASAPVTRNAMHSHDRTMLASLGFADSDKQNPEHDRICRYLVQPDVVTKIGKWLGTRLGQLKYQITSFDVVSGRTEEFLGKVTALHSPAGTARNEFHLTKGSGSYVTTVGFLDAVFELARDMDVMQDQMWLRDPGKWGPLPAGWVPKLRVDSEFPWRFFAEVKVAKIPAGDLLRQLQLYKTFFDYNSEHRPAAPFGIVVAPWDMTESENSELVKAGFAFLKVGDDYRKWAETDAKTVATPQFTL